MIFALLACKGEPEDSAQPPAEEPVEGAWTITIADSWGGDCRLDDMSTRLGEPVVWTLELHSSYLIFYDEWGYPLSCARVGMDFGCDTGSTTLGYDGYDAWVTVRVHYPGAFTDPTHLEGAYAIEASCAGEDCGVIGEGYGKDFEYPCTASAPLSGVAGG